MKEKCKAQAMTLHDLVSQSWEIAEAKGWHRLSATFVERLCLIHSEVSEALEDYRSGRDITEVYYENDRPGQKDKPAGIPIELADIMIRVGDLCAVYQIDIEDAIKLKHAYNRTRPVLHGGKRL